MEKAVETSVNEPKYSDLGPKIAAWAIVVIVAYLFIAQ